MDPLLMDKRVVERNIEKGLITREEYEEYRAKLPDLEEECEEVEVSLYKTDEEEDESTEEAEVSPDEIAGEETEAQG